ncbi:hypothetical protein BH09PAT2_BH09PAT2_07480 [soil metagenome]
MESEHSGSDLAHYLSMIKSGSEILDTLDENHPEFEWFSTAVSGYISIIMFGVELGDYSEDELPKVSKWIGADLRIQTENGVI